MLGVWVASTVIFGLTASVDIQLRGDKECPFSGVTSSGRVGGTEVPESDARSVCSALSYSEAKLKTILFS